MYIVLKKGKQDGKTLFIDASEEFVKVTNNNRLSKDNIDKIVEAYAKRENVDHFAHLASIEEIEEHNYNLSVSTYVEPEDTREVIDIKVLNAGIEGIVERVDYLRVEINKVIAEIEGGQDE